MSVPTPSAWDSASSRNSTATPGSTSRGLVDIGAAADATVWHINSGAEIYRYTGDQPS
ncbi:hypothetical protein [Streptomyces sp. NPDC006477]|uniref:hypothetical protein n=1 Tax=Streptomyces sp. NPDC006477 TaxID=3364747 RepID=UPI0036AF15C9